MGKYDDSSSTHRGHQNNAQGEFRDPYPPHQRKRLEWGDVHTIVQGGVEATIRRAAKDNGDHLYSFVLKKAPQGDRPSSMFLSAEHFAALKTIGDAVSSWIDADRIASRAA